MNIHWPHADGDDLLRLKSIKILLGSQPQLLAYLFHKDKPCLQNPPEQILCSIGSFSHGEVILITLALDLWNGSGDTNLYVALRTLDEKCWLNFLMALSVFS